MFHTGNQRNYSWSLVLFLVILIACAGKDTPDKPANPQGFVTTNRIVTSVNDAEEMVSGKVDLSSTDLELGEDEERQIVGLRFTNVDIPKDATLTRAYLQFQVDETSLNPTSLEIRAEAANNPQAFSRTLGDISSRSLSDTSVLWSPAPWPTVGGTATNQQSPDLIPILQSIVNGPDWIRGNAIALIVTGKGKRVAESFDGKAEAAPSLHIEYLLESDFELTHFDVNSQRIKLGEEVTFSWAFAEQESDTVHCQLTLGNDIAAYEFEDCQTQTQQTHTFSQPGFIMAHLTAKDEKNTMTLGLPLWVSTPETKVLVAAGDIACDPEAESFNGGEGTATSCHMKATSDLVLQQFPDAVAVLGDIQYEDGAYWKFLDSYDPTWGRFKSITYPAVGNHEYLVPGAEGYYNYFGELAGDPTKGYYSYILGTWQIVVLNSNCTFAGGCGQQSPQNIWLKEVLSVDPKFCTLAYWHHPLFSSGAIGSIDWTVPLWQTLYEAGAELVLTGHDHHYERFAPQTANGEFDERGLRQFVIGGGGKNHTDVLDILPTSEVQHSGTFGVLRLNLHPESYDWQFIGETEGAFEDLGSANCH